MPSTGLADAQRLCCSCLPDWDMQCWLLLCWQDVQMLLWALVAGSLQALSAMVQLELPHVNVLTKVDLLSDKVRLPAGS